MAVNHLEKRKVILYISMSLDGFIATKDDDLSWLSMVEKEGEDYGYFDLKEKVDTYIVGRSTYDVVLALTGGSFPQSEWFNSYVITRKDREDENGIKFYNGDIEKLILDLKNKEGKHIYCDGGGQIVKLLMELFIGGILPISLKAVSTKNFESGLIQVHYKKK